MICQEKNVIDLNEYARFPYHWFNSFNHQGKATTDPIEQHNIRDNVDDFVTDLSPIAKSLLLKIIRETCRRGQYYTFMSHAQFAEYLGRSERSVRAAIEELRQAGWIMTTRSWSKPFHLITDFNVEKAMALGKKGKETSDNAKAEISATGNNCRYNIEETKDLSKDKSSSLDKDKILDRVKRRRRKPKPRMTAHSLSKTWKSAFTENCTMVQCKITEMDKNKLGNLTGDSRRQGRWKGSIDDLHHLVADSVKYWEFYCHKIPGNSPKLPTIGYFISCFDRFFEIWLDEQKEELDIFDEKVIELNAKKMESIDNKEKWKKKLYDY